MKKHLNPPEDSEAFNEHFGQYAAANGARLLGTVLGIITEFAIITALIKSHVQTFMPFVPAWITVACGGVIVLLLARERLRYATEISKTWLSFSFQKGKGVMLEKGRSLGWEAIVITHIIFFAVFGASAAISYLGSITMVTDAYVPPVIESTKEKDSEAQAQIKALNEQFSLDSTTIAGSYKSQREATYNGYTSKIRRLQKEAKVKTWLAAKNGKKIDELSQKRDDEIATLKNAQADALQDLSRRKVETVNTLNRAHSDTKLIVLSRNQKSEQTSMYLYQRATQWFPIIIIASMFLIVFASVIIEKFKRKAGIKEVIIPSEHELKPSLLSEFSEAISSFVQSIFRHLAFWIKSKSWEAPDTQVDKLLRINLKKYNEKLFDVGNDKDEDIVPFAPASGGSNPIGYMPYDNEKDRVSELVDKYRINRQQYNIYTKKTGKDETINAGLTRHANAMMEAEMALNELGYKLVVTKAKIYAEKQ